MKVKNLVVDDVFIIPDGRVYYVDRAKADGNVYHVTCLGRRMRDGNLSLTRFAVHNEIHKDVTCIRLASVVMLGEYVKDTYKDVSTFRGVYCNISMSVGRLNLDDVFVLPHPDNRIFYVGCPAGPDNGSAQVYCLGYYRQKFGVALLRKRELTHCHKSVACQKLSRVDMRASTLNLCEPLPRPPLQAEFLDDLAYML